MSDRDKILDSKSDLVIIKFKTYHNLNFVAKYSIYKHKHQKKLF